jgi:prepilin peptidase CpaA
LTTLANPPIALPRTGRHRGLAVACGLLLAASVLASGWGASLPLPILGWAAAFLFFAVERDLHCQRIPNWLTLPTLAAAPLYGALIGGWDGALDALLGAAAGFVLLVLPYAVGALGAGDVKAAMALGGLFGARDMAAVVLLAIGFGGAFALLRLAVQGGFAELARRWLHGFAASLLARRVVYFPPAPGAAASRGVPFALALALAVAANQLMEISR